MTWLFATLGVIAAGWLLGPRLARALIRARLGPYRARFNTVDDTRPERLNGPRKVAVIGGGVAGIASAQSLGRRGFTVTLFDANPYLGGKLGAWPVALKNGETALVSHGFHAFFRHYYNLNNYLDALGVRQQFKSIGDYVILSPDGSSVRFADLERTPVLNLISMAKKGVYRPRDVLFGPAKDMLGVFLEYDQDKTFAQWDGVSLAEFDRLAQLPPKLKVAFNTFSRAFFADMDKLSMAELVKSFHFYYLSQDGGLVYDVPTRDFEPAILKPIRDDLEAHGVTIKLGHRVAQLAKTAAGFEVDGEAFEQVILSTDVVGSRALVTQAQGLNNPALTAQLDALKPGQRYAVLRLWVDKDIRTELPGFVITDRVQLLDSFTTWGRLEAESREYVERHGGAVWELHSYAVPDSLETPEAVRAALLEELVQFFPEAKGFSIRDEHFQLRRDFTAFHVGAHAGRPATDSGVPGLFFAGDWVKLPFPAMLLEAAFASGLVAANRVLALHGLKEEPVECVPLRGVMAGMPPPPGRKKLLEAAVVKPTQV